MVQVTDPLYFSMLESLLIMVCVHRCDPHRGHGTSLRVMVIVSAKKGIVQDIKTYPNNQSTVSNLADNGGACLCSQLMK